MRNIRAVKGGRGRPPLQAPNAVCSVIQFFSPVRLNGLSHLFLDETAHLLFIYFAVGKLSFSRSETVIRPSFGQNVA